MLQVALARVACVASQPLLLGTQEDFIMGSQTSARPPNPNVLKPIVSRAYVAVEDDRIGPGDLAAVLLLDGPESRRALSRLTLSGQLLSGAHRCCPRDPFDPNLRMTHHHQHEILVHDDYHSQQYTFLHS